MRELDEVPFAPGERVFVWLENTGPVPDLRDGEPGTVISVHAEDETRDYPWCMVRLGDGREIALPELMLRHGEPEA